MRLKVYVRFTKRKLRRSRLLWQLRWYYFKEVGRRKFKPLSIRSYIHLVKNRLGTVPTDEFDPSLNLDVEAMERMSPEQAEIYRRRIMERRDKAHRRDLERTC